MAGPVAVFDEHHSSLPRAARRGRRGGKKWLTTMLGFRVEREFQIPGHDFALPLSPGGAQGPRSSNSIGGPLESERQLPENIPDMMKLAGWHHICLQVR